VGRCVSYIAVNCSTGEDLALHIAVLNWIGILKGAKGRKWVGGFIETALSRQEVLSFIYILLAQQAVQGRLMG